FESHVLEKLILLSPWFQEIPRDFSDGAEAVHHDQLVGYSSAGFNFDKGNELQDLQRVNPAIIKKRRIRPGLFLRIGEKLVIHKLEQALHWMFHRQQFPGTAGCQLWSSR